MSNDNRALANKSLDEIEEIDAAGTIALTDYIIVSDGNVPKKIKVSVLVALIAPTIAFTDLSDTPAALVADEALITNAGGTAIESQGNTFLNLVDTPAAYSDGDTVQSSASAIVLTTV